jgi:hypothetical protein
LFFFLIGYGYSFYEKASAAANVKVRPNLQTLVGVKLFCQITLTIGHDITMEMN